MILPDGLMFGCQRSSGKYIIHIQDKNKFNNIQKLYRNEKLMRQWLLITNKNWLDNDSWLPLEIDGTMTVDYH
jgi:hypothetical protein